MLRKATLPNCEVRSLSGGKSELVHEESVNRFMDLTSINGGLKEEQERQEDQRPADWSIRRKRGKEKNPEETKNTVVSVKRFNGTIPRTRAPRKRNQIPGC